MRSRLVLAVLIAGIAFGCAGSAGDTAPPGPKNGSTPTAGPVAKGIFAYAANSATDTLDGFAVAQSDGSLRPLANASVSLPGEPRALAIDQRGRFAYVGMRRASTTVATYTALAVYAINSETGALSLVPSSKLAPPPVRPEVRWYGQEDETRFQASSISLDPSGRFAFVVFDSCGACTCGVDTWLYSYAVDSETGRLTPLDVPPADFGPTGDGDLPPLGRSLLVVEHGRYLYAASRGEDSGGAEACSTQGSNLRGFSIDSATGRLEDEAEYSYADPLDGSFDWWLGLRPSGDYLYYAREVPWYAPEVDNRTLVFRANGATGALTEVVARLPRILAGAFTSTGRLYAASVTDPTTGLQLYDVEARTGRLVPKPGAFFETYGYPTTVEIDARDRFLFSVSAGVISAFRIDPATGTLDPGHRTFGLTSPYDGSDFRRLAIANVR